MPTPKEIKNQAQLIKDWFNRCDINNPKHRAGLKRAAQQIFSRQTEDEQATDDTRWLNGRGFAGRDAEFGSRIAKWNGDITVRMAAGARKMLAKYSRQLAEMKLGIS
jgi:hypothetical protein